MILLAITLLYTIQLFKTINSKKYNPQLNCGLVGFNGSQPPNVNKLQILGMLNVQRGKHSCGIAINNQVAYGVGVESEFQDFIAKYKIPEEFDKSRNVIIHTRHATIGSHTIDNAHPFCFVDNANDEEYSFIGAHNGTISNWKDLIKELNIDDNGFNVDSEALLASIFITKNFKVLSKYKGAAALLFTWTKEANTLYAFRGAAGDKDERPLYYTKSKEGVYFSSLANALKISENHDGDIYEVPANTVLKFTDGKIVGSYKIYRAKELHADYVEPKKVSFGAAAIQTNIFEQNKTSNHNSIASNHITESKLALSEKLNNLGEVKINNSFKFKNLRYYRNGHLAQGVYSLESITGLSKDAKEEVYFWYGIMVKSKLCFEELNKIGYETCKTSWLSLSKNFVTPANYIQFRKSNALSIEDLEYYFMHNGAYCSGKIEFQFPFIHEFNFKIEYSKLTSIEQIKLEEKESEEILEDLHTRIEDALLAIEDALESLTEYVEYEGGEENEETVKTWLVLENTKADLELLLNKKNNEQK